MMRIEQVDIVLSAMLRMDITFSNGITWDTLSTNIHSECITLLTKTILKTYTFEKFNTKLFRNNIEFLYKEANLHTTLVDPPGISSIRNEADYEILILILQIYKM